MNIEEVREYCLAKNAVTESLPFGPDALVFKVLDKMFALISLTEEPGMNLKCDPDYALELRDEYEYIRPGYHMNKKHWNTVDLFLQPDGELLRSLIDHSYELVVAKMKKADRDRLQM